MSTQLLKFPEFLWCVHNHQYNDNDDDDNYDDYNDDDYDQEDQRFGVSPTYQFIFFISYKIHIKKTLS